jgi:hypothetical protein
VGVEDRQREGSQIIKFPGLTFSASRAEVYFVWEYKI